jgi:hypothetical protein
MPTSGPAKEKGKEVATPPGALSARAFLKLGRCFGTPRWYALAGMPSLMDRCKHGSEQASQQEHGRLVQGRSGRQDESWPASGDCKGSARNDVNEASGAAREVPSLYEAHFGSSDGTKAQGSVSPQRSPLSLAAVDGMDDLVFNCSPAPAGR